MGLALPPHGGYRRRGRGAADTAAGRGFVGAAGRASEVASIEETVRALAEGLIDTHNDLFSIGVPGKP